MSKLNESKEKLTKNYYHTTITRASVISLNFPFLFTNLEGILKFVTNYVNKSTTLHNHKLALAQMIWAGLFPTFDRKHLV